MADHSTWLKFGDRECTGHIIRPCSMDIPSGRTRVRYRGVGTELWMVAVVERHKAAWDIFAPKHLWHCNQPLWRTVLLEGESINGVT
ncbi:hypothetical protein ACOMHN_041873 [Nucella lapillus]